MEELTFTGNVNDKTPLPSSKFGTEHHSMLITGVYRTPEHGGILFELQNSRNCQIFSQIGLDLLLSMDRCCDQVTFIHPRVKCGQDGGWESDTDGRTEYLRDAAHFVAVVPSLWHFPDEQRRERSVNEYTPCFVEPHHEGKEWAYIVS